MDNVQKVADALQTAHAEGAGLFDLKLYLEKAGYENKTLIYDNGPYGYMLTVDTPQGMVVIVAHSGVEVEDTDVVVGPWVVGTV